MFVRVVAGGRTERKKQDPSPTSCRDRSKPAVPPCLTLARPLYAYANMPTFVNGASAPARILATRLSARPRKSIRSRSACRDPSARDSLKDDLGTYLPFLIGLLDCSTALFSCQGVFEKKFSRKKSPAPRGSRAVNHARLSTVNGMTERNETGFGVFALVGVVPYDRERKRRKARRGGHFCPPLFRLVRSVG